jgi:hypothetical protein
MERLQDVLLVIAGLAVAGLLGAFFVCGWANLTEVRFGEHRQRNIIAVVISCLMLLIFLFLRVVL